MKAAVAERRIRDLAILRNTVLCWISGTHQACTVAAYSAQHRVVKYEHRWRSTYGIDCCSLHIVPPSWWRPHWIGPETQRCATVDAAEGRPSVADVPTASISGFHRTRLLRAPMTSRRCLRARIQSTSFRASLAVRYTVRDPALRWTARQSAMACVVRHRRRHPPAECYPCKRPRRGTGRRGNAPVPRRGPPGSLSPAGQCRLWWRSTPRRQSLCRKSARTRSGYRWAGRAPRNAVENCAFPESSSLVVGRAAHMASASRSAVRPANAVGLVQWLSLCMPRSGPKVEQNTFPVRRRSFC